ncbi:MAG: hypothetical protein IJA78_02905 [Clostridia bacterium]|nr:hypothetical protein [Clostridia bacterium]
MKRTISFLLAILMIVGIVPLLGLAVGAEGDTDPTTTYVVYQEDFNDLDASLGKEQLLQSLGWYVPDEKIAYDIADYSVVGDESDRALRVATTTPIGLNRDSFVTVFGGDVMSVVRSGNFTLSYQLTYRRGTTNTEGYSALIYNYNEKHGAAVTETGSETYGIVAVRVCGTGMNNLYSSIGEGSAMMVLENYANTAANVMSNRYTTSGAYPSLYARLVEGAQEAEGDVRTGTDVMIDVPMDITIQYSYTQGITVLINGMVVSQTNTEFDDGPMHNTALWQDFVTRSDGAAIALMTKPNVVAEIDDIKIVASGVGDGTADQELPELLITEILPVAASGNNWAEYVELHNPTDRYVNLMDYSIVIGDSNTDGGAGDLVTGSRMKKFSRAVSFASLLGKPTKGKTAYYVYDNTVENMPEGSYEWYGDPSARYTLSGTSYVEDPNGRYCHIYYLETWNTRYDTSSTPESDYQTSTYLAPGDTMLIFFMNHSLEETWQYGVNGGQNFDANGNPIQSIEIYPGAYSFRKYASWYGATEETKVMALADFYLPNSTSQMYAICKTNDANGKPITWTDRYTHDLEDIVCCVDYTSSLNAGIQYEGNDPSNSNFGKGGVYERNYSANYVYGIDASRDFRYGTLYVTRSAVNKTGAEYRHMGKLAGYQEVVISNFYSDVTSAMPELMITEITPVTTTLAGTSYNAFSAIEVTNTSDRPLDLYRYALVRTDAGIECTVGEGFTHVVELKGGNPVTRGEANGAYYYFMGDHISNPENCFVEPGESAVVWMLTSDTYSAYNGDDDFGFDYFRQYWVNNGCAELGRKDATGAYDIPVVAVDANVSTTFNADNASRVFDISNDSAVYGVAIASERVLKGRIAANEVFSIACLGYIFTNYDLKPQTVTSGEAHYANILSYSQFPVNKSVRYVAGLFPAARMSAITDALKVQEYFLNTGLKYSYLVSDYVPGETQLAHTLRTSNAFTSVGLGAVEGKEATAIRDLLFVADTDELGNVTYYYYDSARTGITTLQGAALMASGSALRLRFDSAIYRDVYNGLVATYGAQNVKVGMLVVETAKVANRVNFTKQDLIRASIAHSDLEAAYLYSDAKYAVFGGYYTVPNAKKNTSYTAIGYLEVKLPDQTVQTLWSSVTASGSAADVAERALDDVRIEQDAIYTYWCMVDGQSYYCPYSSAQRNWLKQVAGV